MEARPPKKSARKPKSCAIASVPDPILMEILCRVPFKTLTASKIVCKSWLNLIKDPQFPHLHQSIAPTEVFFQPATMKLHLGNFDFPKNLFPYHFELHRFSVSNYLDVNKNLLFANSCNGLLCYYAEYGVKRVALVWNPCTSEFITFPPPEFNKGLSTCRGYGLGFSTKTNKFKLLRLIGGDGIFSPSNDMVVADVCTIEKGCSWKRVGPCSSSPKLFRDLQGVFLKGTLHWVVRSEGRDSCIAVHTFDFEDDRFGSVPLPDCLGKTSGDLHPSREDTLGVLGGCLFLADHRNERVITIWLMKEYGVQDSWTRLFCFQSTLQKGSEVKYSFQSTLQKGSEVKYSHCLPITYMDSGAILMKCTKTNSSDIIIYNPVLRSARVMGSCPVSVRVIAYSPSLVMLKDSMLGYDVHAIPRSPEVQLERRKKPRALDGWIPVMKYAKKRGSKVPFAGWKKVYEFSEKRLEEIMKLEERFELLKEPELESSMKISMMEKTFVLFYLKNLKKRKLQDELQQLENMDESKMTEEQWYHHQREIERYKNLIAVTC